MDLSLLGQLKHQVVELEEDVAENEVMASRYKQEIEANEDSRRAIQVIKDR